MGLILNRRREMGGGEVLPSGAVKIQYLQGTGESYINSGLNITGNVGYPIEMKFCIPSQPSGESWMIGSWDGSWKPYLIGYYNNTLSILMGSSTFHQIAWDSNYHIAKVDTSGIYFDGVKKADVNLRSIMNITNITIFRATHTNSPSAKRIEYLKMWDINGNIVRDYIPVRVGQVGYLYDKVSKTLFGNAGSGSFTLGPDV